MPIAQADANPRYAAIVVDAKSGKVLFERYADAKRYPASLTKIMTLFIVFEELEAGRLKLDTPLKVSAYAAGRPPSKIGFKPGQTIRVKDAILALVTKSANDVAATVAENISGSQSAFAQRMTRTARAIGMRNTRFANASGLPDNRQVTTARDMALLGRAIQDRFPKYYTYFKTRSFKYRGRTYSNHNKLLGRVKGVDGIKTGFIRASGFNLVSSVKRDNRHIVAVVMGGRSGATRNAHMTDLIQTYLPRATRGRQTAPQLVAGSSSDGIGVVAHIMQVPVAKPTSGMATAYIAGTQPRTSAVASIEHLIMRHLGNGAAAKPAKAVASEGAADATLDTAPPKGWHVQIGAADSPAAAIVLLERAENRVPNAVRGQKRYTEAVKVQGQTLHRARFAGYETKAAAWRACELLKRARFDCFAVDP